MMLLRTLAVSTALAVFTNFVTVTVAGTAGAVPAAPCTVALDPGHNGTVTNTFDPVTGVLMADYPNGREDADALDIARAVGRNLDSVGYRAVLLKNSTKDNVTYRQRVDRAAGAGSVVGVSVHTTPGESGSAVFPQRVGSFRTGTGEDGQSHTVTFDDTGHAATSQRFSTAIAGARSLAEGRGVRVTDNSFDGRPGLWAGNLPVISLVADIPWVYNEFGSAAGGGAYGLTDAEKSRYVTGLTAGLLAALAASPQCAAAGSVTGSAS